jgi:valyl-tRNA synthetase
LETWPLGVAKDDEAEIKGEIARDIISALRNWKSERGLPLNSEIAMVEIVAKDKTDLFSDIERDIIKTVRTRDFDIVEEVELAEIPVAVKPIFATIGPTFRGQVQEIVNKLKTVDIMEISKGLDEEGYDLTLDGGEKVKLTKDHVKVEKSLSSQGRELDALAVSGFTVLVAK